MWWALFLEFIVIGICVVLVMRYLMARNIPKHVLISVWVSWTSALSLVCLVPIDLNLAYLKRCIEHFGDDARSREEICPTKYWLSWGGNLAAENDIDSAMRLSERAIRASWLWVFSVCQVNGWILLTFQQSFVEAQHFQTKERLMQATKENAGFYAVCGAGSVVFVALLYILGRDLAFWIGAVLALFNAICLLIVAVMLGYGLAEAPKAIFQKARAKPTLRRALYNVFVCHKDYTTSADMLAATLAQIFLLRKAAGNTLRHLSKEIITIMDDCPFDLSSAILMHPTRGPSIPMTREEMHSAFLTRLQEIEAGAVFDYQMTEVDQWITSLENAQLLPRGADVFGIQEALLEGGHKLLGDLDTIDPGHKGLDVATKEQRQKAIQKAIDDMNLPGTPLVHRSLIAAIMKRNDEANAPLEDDDGEIHNGEQIEDPDLWNIDRLVGLRKELYLAGKKYRRSKKKFDAHSEHTVFLQDVRNAREDLGDFKTMMNNLLRAFKYDDCNPVTGWAGLQSPVRANWTGPYALKLEVLSFVWLAVLSSWFKLLASFVCAAGALIVLWTEISVFPGIKGIFKDAQQGSILLYSVCAAASVPPGCFNDEIPPQPWQQAWEVRTWVQWMIVMHLAFICGVLYFSLLRLKIFSIYEVVVGETDAFSLLFNAYAVCRLAPSIANNYLNLLQEAHETPQPGGTVFERMFGAMGAIPFTSLTFNEVLPPFVLLSYIVTIGNALTRKCVECPRLDGEAHKTDEMIDEALGIARLERRKYENRAKLKSSVKRTRELEAAKMEAAANRRREQIEKENEIKKLAQEKMEGAGKAWGKVKGVVTAVQMKNLANSPYSGHSPISSVRGENDGDKAAMLDHVELGGDLFADSEEARPAGAAASSHETPGKSSPSPWELAGGSRSEGPKWAKKPLNPTSWKGASVTYPTVYSPATPPKPGSAGATLPAGKYSKQAAELMDDLADI